MTKESSLTAELFDLLNKTIELLREEIVSLRNEVVLNKLEVGELRSKVELLSEDKSSKTKMIVAYIAAGASILIAGIQTFKH